MGRACASTTATRRATSTQPTLIPDGRPPDVVVYPESTSQVASVLEYADRKPVPVVPFGAGTSLEGHIIPTKRRRPGSSSKPPRARTDSGFPRRCRSRRSSPARAYVGALDRVAGGRPGNRRSREHQCGIRRAGASRARSAMSAAGVSETARPIRRLTLYRCPASVRVAGAPTNVRRGPTATFSGLHPRTSSVRSA